MSSIADTKERRQPTTDRLVRVALPADGVEAVSLLRSASGPRGYWRCEGRWAAWTGAAACIQAEVGSAGRRFQRVRAQADMCLGRIRDPGPVSADALRPGSSNEDGPPSPELRSRFYGGFAFHPDERSEAAWRGFPAAFFCHPSLELRGEDSGRRWLVGTFPTEREDPSEAVEGASERLRHVRDRLQALTEEPGRVAGRGRETGSAPVTPRQLVGRSAWTRGVEEALAEIRSGRLRKVVLARAAEVATDGPADPVDLLVRLWGENPGTHPFLYVPDGRGALVGAAPEVLGSKRGERFRATVVAGTIGRSDDAEEDGRLARELLESAKDQAEHAIAVEEMRDLLTQAVGDVRVESEPGILRLRGMHHLQTHVSARVEEDEHILSLLETLHPTAAVNGYPRDRARRFLRDREGFQRGWYAGPVGWFDSEGDGEFVPALRSALVRDGSVRFFAGAGIVDGSDPEREWEETELKLRPVLRALEGSSAAGG